MIGTGGSMNTEKVGKYISKLRKEKGLTQEELAERIGVNSKTISKWETGINVPDTVLLFELSKELGVSIQELLNCGETNSFNDSKILVEGISFYNKIFKKKAIKICSVIIFAVLFIFAALFTFNNYNKNHVYDIQSKNSDYSVDGYLIFNPKESLFIIDSISYESEITGTDNEPTIVQCDIFVKSKNKEKIYYSESKEIVGKNKISSIVDSLSISFSSYQGNESLSLKNKNLDNFSLIIAYTDKDNKYYEDVIDLKINKHYSSNKLIY